MHPFSLRRENSECHCTDYMYFTLHSYCHSYCIHTGSIIHSELWMISAEWFGLSFVLFFKNTLFLLLCSKIYNHSVSCESKKYSKRELETPSSAWTKCRHTADTNIVNIDCCNSNLIQRLSTTIFTPVFTVCDQRKWLFSVLFTCIVFVFNLSTVAKCMNVLYLYSLNQLGNFFYSESMCMTSWVTEDKKHDIILNVCLFYLIHTCN